MDSLFSRFFGGGWLAPFEEEFGPMRGWGFDVDENDKEIVVRADMPGFEENELDVRLENEVLTIKAEKEQKGDRQREYRSFFRQVRLPAGIDTEKVQASYRNGVLELHIPRPEGSQAKRIPIQGGQAAPQGKPSVTGQTGTAAPQQGKK
jgi:HSP20 family protein